MEYYIRFDDTGGWKKGNSSVISNLRRFTDQTCISFLYDQEIMLIPDYAKEMTIDITMTIKQRNL